MRLNCLEADRRLSDTRDRPTAIGSSACSRSLSPNKGVAAMRLIELSDISKTYRLGQVEVPVLRGISMAVEPGEFVALMGASGSGKSTLMHLLGFLDRPTSGRYWFEGREVSSLSADERAWLRNRKIGFVFEFQPASPHQCARKRADASLVQLREALRPGGTHEGPGAA